MKVVRSRLEKGMSEIALKLTSSLHHDHFIFHYDILVDAAHVLNLFKNGHISREDAAKILSALLEIRDTGYNALSREYEDVHEAIEAKVIEMAGEAGRKMHTGRSRNDEVATCLRLFARDRLLSTAQAVLRLREVLLERAEKDDSVMPGFTHLQYAQPTRLSHHLLAYHDMLERDYQRIIDAFKRVNLSPLGSAAFASTGFMLDRAYTAKLLGFKDIVENSMDAVATRDFAIESIFVSCSLMLSLSRIAEELILWSSEFNFVELPDECTSSSSIMPQKKNPDVAELIRAKAGRMIGILTAAASVYKAMPYAYNRDFQEINPLLYESLETAELSTLAMVEIMEGVKFRKDVMEEKAGKGFSCATELADTLVRKCNLPFRTAHAIVGRLAMESEKHSITLEQLDRIALEVAGVSVSDRITREELNQILDPKKVVDRRVNTGSTSSQEISRMLNERKRRLKRNAEMLEEIIEEVSAGLEMMYDEVERIINV
jgi:argininosuccinate lyase